jgi:hypothetical protein
MGLDQYAYVAAKAGDYSEYWDNAYWDDINKKYECEKPQPREIQYWRKHPNLHGWMETLWRERTGDNETMFNGIELELTWEDLERLKHDVERGFLPETEGFFFGSNEYDDYYAENVAYTISLLTDLLDECKESEDDCSFYYQASW